MDPEIDAISGGTPVAPIVRPIGTPVTIPPAGSTSFADVLRGTTSSEAATASTPLKFSAHAMARLQSRNIKLSADDMNRLSAMADKAAAKGAKQSLFMMRDVAMVVSIKNRTVITAVDQNSMRDNVFTNIDSAALL